MNTETLLCSDIAENTGLSKAGFYFVDYLMQIQFSLISHCFTKAEIILRLTLKEKGTV